MIPNIPTIPGIAPSANQTKAPEGAAMQLTEDELSALIDRAAHAGSRQALRDLGLHDDDAALDIRDLRDLIKSWRTAKAEAFRAVVKWLATAILLAIVAGLGVNHLKG